MQCTLASFLIALIPGEVVLDYKAGLLGICSSNPSQPANLNGEISSFILSLEGVVRIVEEGEKTRTIVLIPLARPSLE